MKLGSVLSAAALSLGLLLPPHSSAAGPDDIYLDAYRLIQEADQISANQPELARQRYDEAQENLKKLQNSYPAYSKAAVDFRLEYVRDKLKALPAAKEGAQNPAQAQPKPAANLSPQEQIKALSDQVAKLEADNSMLQAKLKEALAPQPAALDPKEFAKAEDRIKQLEKEKELLRVSLEQTQARQPQALDQTQIDQLKAELATAQKQLTGTVASVATLTQENQKLKQDLASASAPKAAPAGSALTEAQANVARLEQERAEWQKQRAELETRLASSGASDSSKVKSLEKERDALLKKLNDANKELYDVKARGQAAQLDSLTNQVANLRARLEVFEARKVPYTQEELALLDKSAQPIARGDNKSDLKPSGKRVAREMPAGAGPLLAAAQLAFNSKRYADAETKYEQILKMDENNPDSLANLAVAQLQTDKLGEAEKNLNKARSIEPNDPYILTVLGILRVNQGKYDEALDTLARAAQLDPKNPETENYLGVALSQKGQREAAETALRKAISLSPNYAGAHRNLAVVYATQKPPFIELAKYHYSKSLALGESPNPEIEKVLNAAASSK